jgi:hypothetical protein
VNRKLLSALIRSGHVGKSSLYVPCVIPRCSVDNSPVGWSPFTPHGAPVSTSPVLRMAAVAKKLLWHSSTGPAHPEIFKIVPFRVRFWCVTTLQPFSSLHFFCSFPSFLLPPPFFSFGANGDAFRGFLPA